MNTYQYMNRWQLEAIAERDRKCDERKKLNRRRFFDGRLAAANRSQAAYFKGSDAYVAPGEYSLMVLAAGKCALGKFGWRSRIHMEAAGLR